MLKCQTILYDPQGATSPGQYKPTSNGNGEVLYISQSSKTIWLFSVKSRTFLAGRSYPSAEMQPLSTGQPKLHVSPKNVSQKNVFTPKCSALSVGLILRRWYPSQRHKTSLKNTGFGYRIRILLNRSIQSKNGILRGTFPPHQSGPGNNGNEEIIHTHHISWSGASPSNGSVLYPRYVF